MKNSFGFLSFVLCVLVACTSFASVAFAQTSVVKQGDAAQIHWELDSEGTLTISLLDGKSDWTSGFPTDTLKTVNGEQIYAACPWGEYTWGSDGRAVTADYSAVKKVVISEGIKTIPMYGFQSNFYDHKEFTTDNLYSTGANSNGIEEIVFPSTLTTIVSWNFGKSAITNLDIPAGVTSIGRAFDNCEKLKTVHFDSKCQLTELCEGLFNGCKALELVVVPASVTKVGDYAFQFDTKVNVIFTGDAPNFVGLPRTFSKGAKVYYIKGTNNWNVDDLTAEGKPLVNATISEISQFPSRYSDYGIVNNTMMWIYADSKLSLIGEGAYGKDFFAYDSPWAKYADKINFVQLGQNITDVADVLGKDNSECLLSQITKTDSYAKVLYSNFTDDDKNCLFAAVGYDADGKAVNYTGNMLNTLKANTSGIMKVDFSTDETVAQSKAFLWKSIAGDALRFGVEKNLYLTAE